MADISSNNFVDKIGARRALLIASAVICVSGLLRSWAPDIATLWVAVAVFGLGGPIVSIGAPKLVSRWFQGAERGFAMGAIVGIFALIGPAQVAGRVVLIALGRRLGTPLAGQIVFGAFPLSLLPLRLNEFMSIQNIDPFTLYFNVKECFTSNPDAAFWFDFGAGSDSGKNTLDTLNVTTIAREETIPIGELAFESCITHRARQHAGDLLAVHLQRDGDVHRALEAVAIAQCLERAGVMGESRFVHGGQLLSLPLVPGEYGHMTAGDRLAEGFAHFDLPTLEGAGQLDARIEKAVVHGTQLNGDSH